ncbi:MAG: Abi-alpha family protein [Stellaceae bacterium]
MSTGEEFAKELAKQLPVKAIYDDAISPSSKQLGQLTADILKTLQLTLAPIQALGALQDRYRAFLDQSLRRVPEPNQISPAPQILGPVIEVLRYEPEGTPIDEMFSNLLSSAMDRARAHLAHPSYPYLIKQLSSDEAKMLIRLADKSKIYRFVQTFMLKEHRFFPEAIEMDEFPRDDLVFPENVRFYVQRLYQLGLAGIFETEREPTRHSDGRQNGERIRYVYRLTELGIHFMEACRPK